MYFIWFDGGDYSGERLCYRFRDSVFNKFEFTVESSGEIIINDNNEWECPCCGNKDHSKMSVVRRTCGYLGSNFWNVGKTKEIKARVMHIGEPDYLAEN